MSRPPLADRMRPRTLDEIAGQEHLVGPGGRLRRALESGSLPSLILWGPPGCGKTTVARVLAREIEASFHPLSAVLAGIAELRRTIQAARRDRPRTTLLFVDEIHRWNKAQQDALLPHVEDGTLTLIGATTENPSFQVIPALRSRARVLTMRQLSAEELAAILRRALDDAERGLAQSGVEVEESVVRRLAELAGGDARRGLNLLEELVGQAARGTRIDDSAAAAWLERCDVDYDRGGDAHYDVASALIKSMRGSDPDAAVYWLARMLAGGEDPRFVARRLVIFASEDVGNAEPRALGVAVAAAQAVALVGMPEARINLAQAAVFLATAPKSNASYKAIEAALAEVERRGVLPVPLHLRNAPTRLLRELGHGRGYLYPHDHPDAIVRQSYLPPELEGRRFYEPRPWGHERLIAERLAWWERKRGD